VAFREASVKTASLVARLVARGLLPLPASRKRRGCR